MKKKQWDELARDIGKTFKTEEAISRLAKEELKSSIVWNAEHIETIINKCNLFPFNRADIDCEKAILTDERVIEVNKKIKELEEEEKNARESKESWESFIKRLNDLCEENHLIREEIKHSHCNVLFFKHEEDIQ